MNAVLILDLNGNRIGTWIAKIADRLKWPSALGLANGKL